MLDRTLRSLALLACMSALALATLGCSETGFSTPTAPTLEDARAGSLDPPVQAASAEALDVPIQVTPATLVLGSPGTYVSVHAEIAYADVDAATLVLNGIAAASTCLDDRGELVARFARDDIESIAYPPEITLTLQGATLSGTPFSGSDTIVVK